MGTAALATPLELRPSTTRSVAHLVLPWVLLAPLLFLAANGNFSFLVGPPAADGSVNSSRSLGLIGYVVFPGVAYSVIFCLLATRLNRLLPFAIRMGWLTVLGVFPLLSPLWSQDPIRSIYNAAAYVIATMFAYYLSLRFSAEQLMSLIKMTGVVVCVFGGLIIALAPRYGISYADVRSAGAWIGIFQDRTSAAKCLTFLLSPALVFGYSRFDWRRVGYIALLTFFIAMTHPVTGVLIGVALTVFMAGLYVSRRLERRAALCVALVFIPAFVLFAVLGSHFLPDVLGFFGRDMTLTGRTDIWQSLWLSVEKRPLLGYGYVAFWQGLNGESANAILAAHWMFGYAHNGFLEIVLQLGFVGLGLFAITFVIAVKNAWFCLRYGRSEATEWFAGLLFLTCMYNIDEETILFPKDLLSILYILACCGLAVQARNLRQSRRELLEQSLATA